MRHGTFLYPHDRTRTQVVENAQTCHLIAQQHTGSQGRKAATQALTVLHPLNRMSDIERLL
jgi:hypothetical protein